MDEYYKGKTAWVTGSSRGLGRCIAEMLAEARIDKEWLRVIFCWR